MEKTKTLKEVNALQGLRGAFICDNRAELLSGTVGLEFDGAAIKKIGLQMIQSMAALEKAGAPATELDFEFDGIRLVARDLPGALLVVFSEPQVDIAMLRMGLNVAVSSLKKNAELQERVARANTQREIVETQLDIASWNLQKSFAAQ